MSSALMVQMVPGIVFLYFVNRSTFASQIYLTSHPSTAAKFRMRFTPQYPAPMMPTVRVGDSLFIVCSQAYIPRLDLYRECATDPKTIFPGTASMPPLKERVNKGGKRGSLSKYKEKTEEYEHEHDREQNKLSMFYGEPPELLKDAKFSKHVILI